MENGTGLDRNKRAYRRFIELVNTQDFGSLPEVVDPEAYREICVGFTPGWVNLPDAIAAFKRVPAGIPDLNARVDDVVAEDDKVYARLTVTGTNTGRFFGVPPTGRPYQVNMFDYARLEDGRIVERIQQSDTLSQIGQMYGGAAKKAGLAAAGIAALSFLKMAIGRRSRRS